MILNQAEIGVKKAVLYHLRVNIIAQIVAILCVGVCTIAAGQLPSLPAYCESPANPIVAENCKPGTSDWHIDHFNGDIEGYASAASVAPGETIHFYVNTQAPKYDLYLFRSGYYGGSGGRLVQIVKDLPGQAQPACHFDRTTGLVSCSNWLASYDLLIPDDWVSGVYLAKLVRPDTGGENFVLFVVRDDERQSEALFQLSVTTYQAYNFYGNKSLYSALSWNYCPTVSGAPRAVKISFDRPSSLTDVFQNAYFWTDYPMVFWLEAQGYDISYNTNLDTHRAGSPGEPNELLEHRVFLSVGHDEYWSQEMRNAITQARDAGVHLAFFSSNTGYWRVRMEADPWGGQPDRVLVSYKTIESGPADPSGHATTTWRDTASINDPENALVGAQYIGDNDIRYFPIRVTAEQARDRIYRYTGLQEMPPGAYVEIGKHLVGWEWDAVADNGYTPENLAVLASSPVYGGLLADDGRLYNYGKANAQVTRYMTASGRMVFAAGTNNWSWGLAIYEPNRVIQQLTCNLLADMGIFPRTPFESLVLDENEIPPSISYTSTSPAGERDAVLIDRLEGLMKAWGVGDFQLLGEISTGPVGEADFKPAGVSSAPHISDVQVTPTADAALISWKTDVDTSGQVWVKFNSGPIDWSLPNGGLGARPIASEAAHEAYTQVHELYVAGLQPDTQYYFQVAGREIGGETAILDERSFRTLGETSVSLRLKYALRPVYRQARCLYLGRETQALAWGGAVVAGLVVLAILWLYARKRRRSK